MVKQRGKIQETSANGHDFFRDKATATPAHSGPTYTKSRQRASQSAGTMLSVRRPKRTFTSRPVHVHISCSSKLGHIYTHTSTNSRNTEVI